jgi:hypothetical protein
MADKKKTIAQITGAAAVAGSAYAGGALLSKSLPKASLRTAKFSGRAAAGLVPGGLLIAAAVAGGEALIRSTQSSDSSYLARHNVKNSKEDGKFVRRK